MAPMLSKHFTDASTAPGIRSRVSGLDKSE